MERGVWGALTNTGSNPSRNLQPQILQTTMTTTMTKRQPVSFEGHVWWEREGTVGSSADGGGHHPAMGPDDPRGVGRDHPQQQTRARPEDEGGEAFGGGCEEPE